MIAPEAPVTAPTPTATTAPGRTKKQPVARPKTLSWAWPSCPYPSGVPGVPCGGRMCARDGDAVCCERDARHWSAREDYEPLLSQPPYADRGLTWAHLCTILPDGIVLPAEESIPPKSGSTPAPPEFGDIGAVSATLGDFGPTLNLISWADLEPEEMKWLPGGYVPVGALAVFAGDGGVGKTRLVMSQAAAVTRRQRWPLHAPPCKDGEEVAEGPTRVLFCGAEDAIRGFLLPAFLAAGGDKTKVASIESLFVPTRDGKGQREVGFDLSERAMEALAGALATREYAEVILDGLTGYVEGDGKGDTVTRRSLTPFVRLLRQQDVAGVGLMHFNKGAKRAADKLIESVAFRNVPRTIYYVVPDPDPAEAGREDYRRLVFNHKLNGGRFRDPFAYRVQDAPVPDSAVRTGAVAWDAGEIAVGLDDALAAADATPDRPEDRARARDCVTSLKELLAEGGLPGDEVAAWRRSLGFSERALDDAKQELGVKARKVGFGGGGRWVLWLPGTPLQAPAPDAEAKSAKVAHSPPKSPKSGGTGGSPDFGAGRTTGQDRYLQAQREFLAAAREGR